MPDTPKTPELPPEWREALCDGLLEHGPLDLHVAASIDRWLAPLLAERERELAEHRERALKTFNERCAEARVLREALEEIRAALGTGRCRQPDCEGCVHERDEAIRLADEALAASPATEPEQEDGAGPATILVSTLRRKLAEMELHDDLPDSHDIGYMACWRELRDWLDTAAAPAGEEGADTTDAPELLRCVDADHGLVRGRIYEVVARERDFVSVRDTVTGEAFSSSGPDGEGRPTIGAYRFEPVARASSSSGEGERWTLRRGEVGGEPYAIATERGARVTFTDEDDRRLALNFADGQPLATLTKHQAEHLLDFVENDMVQTDGVRELADGLRRKLAEMQDEGGAA